MNAPLRVIKLGGSLLDLPDLPSRLRRWLEAQSPAHNAILMGGGALADFIRSADRTHGLGEEASHWLCLRLLSVTARLIATMLPEAELLEDPTALRTQREAGRLSIADPWQFMLQLESACAADRLPHRWDVTSDSIAARLATTLHAAELVLLKSNLPDAPGDLLAAARANYVDGYFPLAAQSLARIRFVNLRDQEFAEQILKPQLAE